MYANLSLFKQYLGIPSSDTSNDDLLTMFLNSAEKKINNLCGVDTFDEQTHTEKIESRKIYATSRWYEVYLKNKPVQQITAINWNEYTWEHGTDYMIIYDRRIIFNSIELWNFWIVSISYVAWYDRAKQIPWQQWTVDELPDDLKLMEMMLASGMRQQHNYEWVSSYKLWDEQITFGSKWTITPDDQYFSFTTLLNKYKNFNLPV